VLRLCAYARRLGTPARSVVLRKDEFQRIVSARHGCRGDRAVERGQFAAVEDRQRQQVDVRDLAGSKQEVAVEPLVVKQRDGVRPEDMPRAAAEFLQQRKRFTNSMVTTPASGRAGKRGAPFRPENQLLLAICGYILSGNPAFGLVAANTMTDTCSSSSSSSTSFWP
jgi:hypothetical protein